MGLVRRGKAQEKDHKVRDTSEPSFMNEAYRVKSEGEVGFKRSPWAPAEPG